MEKQIYDEKTGLMYELRGEQYYPMLKAPEMDMEAIGVWGYRRFQYLRDSKRAILAGMQMAGTLEAHLIETNQRAEQMYSLLVKQYAAIERVNEELKKHNQMQWVGTMNNIHERVTEVINNELIYV